MYSSYWSAICSVVESLIKGVTFLFERVFFGVEKVVLGVEKLDFNNY